MNNDEEKAYGIVAEKLSLLVTQLYEHKSFVQQSTNIHIDGPYFYHSSMSDYENIADYLWKLDILTPLDERKGWANHFRLTCDPEDAAQIAIQNASNGPSFERFLAFYITYREEHGRKDIPNRPIVFLQSGESFLLDDKEIILFDLLSKLGYVTKEETSFTATERLTRLLSCPDTD